jgi:hypothetical protein
VGFVSRSSEENEKMSEGDVACAAEITSNFNALELTDLHETW